MTGDSGLTAVPDWIVTNPVLSDRAVRVWITLMRGVGEGAPTRKELAHGCRCSLNSLDRALRELVDVGALVLEQRRCEDGSLGSNNYHLRTTQP